MAPLTDDGRVLIRILLRDKGFHSLQMIKEFPNRLRNRSTLNGLIKQIDETGTSNSMPHERFE